VCNLSRFLKPNFDENTLIRNQHAILSGDRGLDGRFGFVVYIDILGTTEGHQDYEERFQDFRNAITDRFDSTYWGGKGLAIRGLSDSVFFILQLSEDIPPSPVIGHRLSISLEAQQSRMLSR
jgi:hypothetical protein